MLRFIAVCMFASSGIFGLSAFDRNEDITEPNEITSQGTVTRAFRSLENKPKDDSLVGTFTVEPLNYFDGIPRSEYFDGSKSPYENAFTDPLWKYQWYMHDYRTKLGPVMDLNVVPVYRMGYTGEGINVAIVDSGVDMDHPDLQENLLKDLAYNVPKGKLGDAAPAKSLFTREKENHGTSCAGIVAMTADNSNCGVGIAYNAKIVPIKRDASLLGNDYLTSVSLSHAQDKVDIYSNSWGPVDSGMFMNHIGKLSAAAIDKGTKEGRDGLGSIYIFASGNGRNEDDDNCSADEYVNYIHTIGIGAVNQDGNRAYFSESCSAIYAVAFGLGKRSHIIGPTPDGHCTNDFTGTSAATPQAAAIIALVLQANYLLSYRDVMHLITMGSEVAPLANNYSWKKNGAGFWVSNEFGFGLMNAYNMVKLAKQWTHVPEKTICEFKFDVGKDITFRVNEPARLRQRSDACQNSEKKEEQVFYLEQVMLTTTINHRYRGALSITVTSAKGTETEMLTPRKHDTRHKGLNEWHLKSVHYWGEDPYGEWQIEVKARPMKFQTPDYNETGKLVAFTLGFHGTRDVPNHHTRGLVPRTYSAFSTPDGKSSAIYNK